MKAEGADVRVIRAPECEGSHYGNAIETLYLIGI